MNIDHIIHLLRNPAGYSEETLRMARQAAADRLEAMERMAKVTSGEHDKAELTAEETAFVYRAVHAAHYQALHGSTLYNEGFHTDLVKLYAARRDVDMSLHILKKLKP